MRTQSLELYEPFLGVQTKVDACLSYCFSRRGRQLLEKKVLNFLNVIFLHVIISDVTLMQQSLMRRQLSKQMDNYQGLNNLERKQQYNARFCSYAFDLNNIVVMSQRDHSQRQFQSRSPPRTQRPPSNQRQELYRPQHTERQFHQDSPTRHDVQFYVRKVNRYEAEIARMEHDLSVARFRLSKTEDLDRKYSLLFQENQKTVSDYIDTKEELDKNRKQLDKLHLDHQRAQITIKNLVGQIDAEKRTSEELRAKREELRSKTTSQGQEERQSLKQAFAKELETLKQENRDASEKFKRQISQLKSSMTNKETIQSALNAKLQHIKKQKNSQISRLKELVSSLRDELGQSSCNNQDRARRSRSDLINETQDRIANVRKLAQLIEQTLVEQINNLNATLTKKNQQIQFLIACDKKQLQDHENSENNLRTLVAKLQDKIFAIQRENELQLYNTIQRLKKQYQQNLSKANDEFQQIRLVHVSTVDSLRKTISEQEKEIKILNTQNQLLQGRHKQLARDQQHSVQMLSQKILSLQTEKDQSLRQYTTSMKQIQDEAKVKLEDLHTAIQNKNTQFQILNAQINLKNGEITHLLDQISRLRDINRQKIKKLQDTNAAEQNALNNQVSDFKRRVLQLKRTIHQLESQIADDQASHQLVSQLIKSQLQSQKQANDLLKSRNKFLTEWCEELDRDLKAERVANVNILHDQNISYRQNVQVRQQVRVELQAVKAKQVQQLKNIHKLQKTRLENELSKKEHALRDKKEELSRLLVQYKGLQAKVGKSSKVDRSAEDEGKCRATLEAQILLTENVYNAINIR